MNRTTVYGVVALLAFASVCVLAAQRSAEAETPVVNHGIEIAKGDYPWWRGRDNNDIFTDVVTAPLHWSETKNVRWRTPIPGKGYGTPILVGDGIYLTTCETDESNDNTILSIIVLERKTGKIISRKTLATGKRQHRMHVDNSIAQGTLACDGKRLFYSYALDGHMFLDCVAMDLEPVWRVDLGEVKAWHGYSGSVVLYEDKVVVCADMARGNWGIDAYDRESGRLCWKTPRYNKRGEPSYATPALIHSSGKDQIVLSGPDTTYGYDAKTGEPLWEVPGPSNCCPSGPAWDEKRVYLSGGWPKKVIIAAKTDGSSKEAAWKKTRPIAPYVPGLVCKDGRLYCLSDESGVFCLDCENGGLLWSDKLGEDVYASPVMVGDRLYVFGRSGIGRVYATGGTLKILAENRLDRGVWANPVFADGGMYIRTVDYLCFISETP